VIGRSLRANALVGTGQHDTPPVEEPNTQTVTSGCDHAFHGYNDDEWWSRFQVGVGRRFESGYSVQEWWDAIRAARSSSDRTIVVMYFFGGERRDGDVQEHVEKLAAEANLKVLMITVDLGCAMLTSLSGVRLAQRCLEPGIAAEASPPRNLEDSVRCIVKSARRMVTEGDRICMVAKYKHVQLASEVTVLRAVIGLWSFGAQLRRDLYAVPFVVYNFIDKFDGLTVRHTSPLLSGFATEEYSRDCHVADIRQRGRWASEQSFKTYLDVVSAAHVQSAFHLRGVGQAQAYSETHFADFFPSGVFRSSHG
ncbi:unnamed protein product, partial [Symbiodinium necroappetens]